MPSIKKLLIANRGEIAVRIARTARRMGISTVAVYSDADREASHVQAADEAVHIGLPEPSSSYLNIERILRAAKTSGADAIHPGYGFLSENAAFCEAVVKSGLIFIGPDPYAIKIMGDKARAKRAMIKAGVPCVPGYQGKDQSVKRLVTEAKQVGLPVMIKAAAGGGGKGMRLVQKEAALEDAINLAAAEAKSAFGNGELIIEKAILEPRHVEVQVFADRHGNTVHLGERDCSVQRRHQKVIEESPSPAMTPELREQMGTAAVDAASAVNYVGAGTVEFLLDKSGAFYFLEMNTRLQVEHPVTECVTGLDLVELQLRVSRGERLPFAQEEVRLEGHAIEARLYAESPEEGFLPSTGPILCWETPVGENIRIDDGIASGGEVSPYYDPMVAKIIGYGASREDARRSLISGLENTALFGPSTNRDFLIAVLDSERFAAGDVTTAFIDHEFGEAGFAAKPLTAQQVMLTAVAQNQLASARARELAGHIPSELVGWASAGCLRSVYSYEFAGLVYDVSVEAGPRGDYHVQTGSERVCVKIDHITGCRIRFNVDGVTAEMIFCEVGPDQIYLAAPGRTWKAINLAASVAGDDAAGKGGSVLSPMHGKLLSFDVSVGDEVKSGDRLCVLEAMKLQHVIRAEVDGTVVSVMVEAGAQVSAAELLIEIDQGEPCDENKSD